ncbi:hypothetical protein PGB90_001730 [Kerria lacca]
MDKILDKNDESLLRWRMGLEEEDGNLTDDDESSTEPLLKTVVRTSYLYHLRQSLRKNLEISKQKNTSNIEENMVNKIIKGCSALLEEKCLRNCMIARLYQRMMAQTIKEVKKATNEGQLFNSLKEFAEQQSNKNVLNYSDKEVQTDIDSISFLNKTARVTCADSLYASSNDKECIHNANVNSPINCNSTKVSEKESKLVNGVQPINNWCVKCKRETINEFCDHSPPLDNKKKKISIRYTDKNERNIVNGVDKKIIVKRKKSDELKVIPSVMYNENTSHIADFNLDISSSVAADKNDCFQLKLKSPSFVECIAQWYNLECELEELSSSKRQKLDEKFVQLFGKDHAIDYYFLSDEQKSITCRKRIAKYVVVELTNYYNKKKIASKQLFKTMAKHITSILLGRSLFPDPNEIKKSVEEFFLDGRIINTEEDFYF